MKVLIAEDDPTSCRTMEKDIKEWGYEVVTANNGKEAWETIKKDEIRLAILNGMIPEIDGVELCRRIRREIQEKKSKNTYIILLTDRGHKDDIIEGLSAGADDYMIKPFDFFELKVRLQNGERIIKLEDSCVRLATFDPLTKLLRKDKIFEILDEELNRGWRQNFPTGVIMVDIDRFKRINDTYGHVVGDHVLAEVSSRLKKSIRPYDKAGRYGGDEMLLVLPNCNLNNMKVIAKHLLHSVSEKKIKTEAALLYVTISLGGTSSDISPHVSGDDLVKTSDQALYLAKKKGRNRAVLAKALYSQLKDKP